MSVVAIVISLNSCGVYPISVNCRVVNPESIKIFKLLSGLKSCGVNPIFFNSVRVYRAFMLPAVKPPDFKFDKEYPAVLRSTAVKPPTLKSDV